MDAIQAAYQTNPQLKGERANVKAVHEGVVQARGAFGPQASVTGGPQYQDATVNFPPSLFTNVPTTQHFNSTTAGVDVSVVQPLFTAGKNRAVLSEARAEDQAEEQTLRSTEAKVILNVVTAYMDVLRDRQIAEVAEAEINDLNAIFQGISEEGRLGALSRTDVAQTESRLYAARAQLTLAQRNLALSGAEFLQVVGEAPGELAAPPALAVPDSYDAVFDVAIRDNPDLAAALENEAAARARVREAKSGLGPNISLRLDAIVEPYETYIPNEYQRGVSAQVVVTQPLFTSGVNLSKERQAADRAGAADMAAEETRRDVGRAVAQAWDQHEGVEKALALASAQLAAQETALKGYQLEQRAGARTAIDLLNAEAEFANDKVGVIQDQHDAFVSRAAVLAAMGRLELKYLTPAPAPPASPTQP